ncbi:MAG TPA: nicotinate phosphoribosyltransferase, partial [Gammaproteobacteria bacterium]|nr:nicotinate phosphoribosyltransferase [Gammaproteobacteria bacterium]
EHDVVAAATEPPRGEPLLAPVLRAGRLVTPLPTLDAIRRRAAAELASLPPPLRALDRHAEYRVEISAGLKALAARVDAEFR